MYYLYVLESGVVKRRYIGITEHLEKRIKKHNNGGVRSTKAYTPWTFLYHETYEDKINARKRGLELKNNSWKRNELFKTLY
ncbi:MAG: GIY-YIG nuclease family protein [Parcubacteria group bacterium]|nr:GIY-YIG nuclease family protein [Parcubacteria group bacterium]